VFHEHLSLFIKDRLSLRQFFAGPFFHQILGIPVGPIRVCLADAPLVFAVGGRSTPKRAGEVVSEN
jgi:hypothetical protein